MSSLDRYASVTDLSALKDFSQRPLRKCVRVNTIKTTVEEFLKRAGERGWNCEQVPWCKEGFWVTREGGMGGSVGRDLLHLTGSIYMQEAASMLPVSLLNPQEGEYVLDLCAAPGSKTTQIASLMKNSGVLVSNEPVEKRMWTLKTACNRNGITNTIFTRKTGQWFAKNMTERFHKVLCDAPCTGEGIVRKDPSVLEKINDRVLDKAARIQRELLQTAIDACKVGGEVVYSTCTLTPEENEELVYEVLERNDDLVEIVDVIDTSANCDVRCAKDVLNQLSDDSLKVQQWRNIETPGALRLWPQSFNTEGFFAVVLKKTAPTRSREHTIGVKPRQEELRKHHIAEVQNKFEDIYGTTFMDDDETLILQGDQVVLVKRDVYQWQLPLQNYAIGMPYGRLLKDGRVRLIHELVLARGMRAQKNICHLEKDQLQDLLSGKDSHAPEDVRGDVILFWEGMPIGVGVCKDGFMKNRLSRWMVQEGSV